MATPAPTPRRRLTAGWWLAWLMLPALAGCVGSPAHQPAPQSTMTMRIAPAPAERQCLASLSQTQVNFTPLPDQYFGAGCSTYNAVRLGWLRSDDAHLQLANLGAVTCPLASSLEGWARYGVDRAARQMLGSPLSRIDTMGSYNCRNVAGTDRRSGHASANAVDIAGFVLADGHRISVKGGWSEGTPTERNFLRVIRASACKRFGVVLTPDYNPAHHDHFHLEVGAARGICH
ncbi:extensin family protein [Novosphingobium sp.]|uniref:extensin family protein n=1 Tax=Novosphingobium sp. TaxID=1874826 RepID=UPI003340E68A